MYDTDLKQLIEKTGGYKTHLAHNAGVNDLQKNKGSYSHIYLSLYKMNTNPQRESREPAYKAC